MKLLYITLITISLLLYHGDTHAKSYLFCIADKVKIHINPNLNSDAISFLNKNEKVLYLDKNNQTTDMTFNEVTYKYNWYKIKKDDGTTGWVYGLFLTKRIYTKPNIKIPKESGNFFPIGYSKNDIFVFLIEDFNHAAGACHILNLIIKDKSNKVIFHIEDTISGTGFTLNKNIDPIDDFWNRYYVSINEALNRFNIEYFHDQQNFLKTNSELIIQSKYITDKDLDKEYKYITAYRIYRKFQKGLLIVYETTGDQSIEFVNPEITYTYKGWFDINIVGEIINPITKSSIIILKKHIYPEGTIYWDAFNIFKNK